MNDRPPSPPDTSPIMQTSDQAPPVPASFPIFGGDLFAPDVLADSSAAMRDIRDLGAVVWLRRHNMFAAGRFQEVQTGLRAHDALISGEGVSANEQHIDKAAGVLTKDGELHATTKRLLMKPLMPKGIEALRDRLQAEAEVAVRAALAGGTIDAMAGLASHLPTRVVSTLVGLRVGIDDMLRWSSAGFQAFGPRDRSLTLAAFPVMHGFVAFITRLTADQVVPGSWAAELFAAADRGEITVDIARAMIADYTLPSLDTTMLSTGEMLWRLASTPGAFDAVRADPALITSVVYESVRLASPIRGFTRHVRHDFALGGHVLPAESRIWLLNAAANRDERHYRQPDDFDVARNPRDNLGWGHGRHLCAGMHLARLEMETLLREIVRTTRLIQAATPTRLVNNGAQGFATLPLQIFPV